MQDPFFFSDNLSRDWKWKLCFIKASIYMYIFILINIIFYDNLFFFRTRENIL